ncbi:MAG TPA: hypothetical protein VHD56_09875 [Tepidisphaeraceae bacterium]|nr:hypothetical protein [Tepidisphaeraceae bacterium]
MSSQGVDQLTFDFLPQLPVIVQPCAGQLSSDAGLLLHVAAFNLLNAMRGSVQLPETLRLSAQAGEPLESDGPGHPRRVLASNVGYFEKHRNHTDYPTYRSRGWPIGSGITESGVKLFGKRVKGTEQFWRVEGAETILALRSKWLSEDEHSAYYWLGRPSETRAA